MKLNIKNMVSLRCITVVTDVLEKLGFQGIEVNLGEVSLSENISDARLSQIRPGLLESGFELLEDKKNILIQGIKTHIIQLIYFSDEPLVENLSGTNEKVPFSSLSRTGGIVNAYKAILIAEELMKRKNNKS